MSNKNKTICALLGVLMLGFGILFAAAVKILPIHIILLPAEMKTD